MRIPIVATLLATAIMRAGPGCKRRDRVKIQQTEEEAPQLATTVHVADPRASMQLLSGFYGIEQNAWRWTAGKFTVLLRVPRGAAQKGAAVKLKFAIPDAVMSRLKTVSLGAMIDGNTLAPETYKQSGDYVWERDVAPALLARDSVKIDFFLDKSLPPGSVDARELGVIVTSVGLETK
jgi:hypothetical protein